MDFWPAETRITTNSAPDSLADLVAEGWAKAMKNWSKRNKLPVRFDARRTVPTSEAPDSSPAQPLGEFLAKPEPIEPDK